MLISIWEGCLEFLNSFAIIPPALNHSMNTPQGDFRFMKGLNQNTNLASLLYIFSSCNILLLLPEIVAVLKITSAETVSYTHLTLPTTT